MTLVRRTLAATLATCSALLATSCGGGSGTPGAGNNSLVRIVTTAVPGATTGVSYNTSFVADFPHAPGLYFLSSGVLPDGLALDSNTGELTGFPRQVGTFHFEIGARDGVDPSMPPGRDSSYSEDRHPFTVVVARGAPHILPQTPPAAQYRASYQYPIDVAGGSAPFHFALTGGMLPNGLAVSASGVIGDFPTQAQQSPYPVDVTVTDANGLTDTATLYVVVIVKPLLILTSGFVPPAAQGFPYDSTLELASNGGGAPLTWSQVPPVAGEVNLNSIGLQVTSIGHITDLGAGPNTTGTFLFTVRVVDEPLQVATRQLSIKINPGPVLLSISPKSSSLPGPYTATGINFQPGAKLVLKPGVTQTSVSPVVVNSTTLVFSSPVPKPSNGNGAVDVMVLNPDGGNHTLTGGFVFPAATVSYGQKGFIASALSSTGLDCADINGDGRADIVHCGAAGLTPYSGAATSSVGGLVLLVNQGGSPPTFLPTSLDSGNYYDVKFVDVNLDGRLDIVALGQAAVRVWLNAPLGTFTAGPVSPLPGPGGSAWPSEMAIGRFNNDLIPDIAFGVPHYPSSNISGRVYTMAGSGTGSFTALDGAVSSIPNTYGVISLVCVDADGDGRSEVAAGVGMNPNTGPLFNYSATSAATGLFTGWTSRGGTISQPQYGSTTGIATADFLGNGTNSVVALLTGSPNYSNFRYLALFSGPTLTTVTLLTAPATVGKSIAAIDADFDAKMDFAITTHPGNIVIYRGSTQAVSTTLDTSAGSPSIASPLTGRLASGDVDGDGRPDVLATTSYWAVNGMAANYGATYTLGASGNGGQMGIVYFLNSSN